MNRNEELKLALIYSNPRTAKARDEFLRHAAEPYIKAAEEILFKSPCKILVTPERTKTIYPYSILKALVELRTLYRQAIKIVK